MATAETYPEPHRLELYSWHIHIVVEAGNTTGRQETLYHQLLAGDHVVSY